MSTAAILSVVEEAGLHQRTASDPNLNAFVSANAGSGKTKVLVDRVIRLLLSGAAPSRILCLTYTKAAANEMQTRLFTALGDWSVAGDEELREALASLAPERGRDAPETLRDARALFARAMETPGGLKVQTIHAFCERLLRRFPIEAGVDPGFDVLDEAEARLIGQRAREHVGRAALNDPNIAEAFAVLAANVADADVDAFLNWASDKRDGLEAWLVEIGGVGAAEEALAARLGQQLGAQAAEIKRDAWNDAPHDDLRRAAEVLQLGKQTDQRTSGAIQAALQCIDAAQAFDVYATLIFTQGGSDNGEGPPRKMFATKDMLEKHPFVCKLFGSGADDPGDEVDRMTDAREAVRRAQALELSVAGLRIAAAYVAEYERDKRRKGALDFNDLIAAAGRLLSQSAAAEWVLYKLDGGVEHILVDEAQDTAPEQWALINALSEEFFAGVGAREGTRTVFAVGDEKQSIYSFQGADPRRFLAETRAMNDRVLAAGQTFRVPALAVSFRSAPAILRVVDEALGLPDVRESMLARGAPPTTDHDHVAARGDTEGCVELWPLIAAEDADEEELDWSEPLDAKPTAHPRELTARAVAETIAEWIAGGETIFDKKEGGGRAARPMRAGDIMVLVRKRGELFERIIQRLKAAGVPVAGADRMTLPAQLAVEDVLGLARAALLPEDDLALAELLKSPFLDPVDGKPPVIDDEALFDLAHGREGRLIDALRASTDKRFGEAKEFVDWLIGAARADTPFGFFAAALDRAGRTGESLAKRLYARLGPEAEDPVKELLSRALAHERRGAPSLERFVAETLADASQVKRETATPRDEVRVMTVHAAKGLEAPVVFLPDAGEPRGGARDSDPFFEREDGLIWSPRKATAPQLVERLSDERRSDALAEDLRLFYVALTRACDRLVICGAKPGRSSKDQSWHALAYDAMAACGADAIETPAGEGLRVGAPPPAQTPEKAKAKKAVSAPRWLDQPVKEKAGAVRMRSPAEGLSGTGYTPPVMSPLAEGGADRFRRGALIHTLLQALPDLAPERRTAAARAYLTAEGVELAAAEEIVGETLAVIEDERFAAIFAPGSRAEVAVAGGADGLPPGYLANGRIDRLAVSDDEVLVVDFKTNRPPPSRPEDVAPVYLEQMAIYRALLRKLHPGKPVRAALVWTDGPSLMPLPDSLLDSALKSG